MSPVIVLSSIPAVLALASYRIVRRPVLSAVVAALAASVGLQIFVRLQLGHMDKLWPIAAVTSFISSLAVALAVVFAWRYLAKRREGGR